MDRKEYRDRMDFKNGWGLSIISGPNTYSDNGTFEVAVLDPQGNINYDHTNGDILSYQSVQDIEVIAKKISGLRS